MTKPILSLFIFMVFPCLMVIGQESTEDLAKASPKTLTEANGQQHEFPNIR